MKVPLSLRVFVDEMCRFAPVRRAGTWAYWQAAESAARKLAACRGVVSVRLRGGMVRRCRPGISDLDFTVITADADEAGEKRDTQRILGVYLRLKRQLPMLGELTLAPASRWALFESLAPGPLIWYQRQLELDRGRWIERERGGMPHPASLFSVAYDHFTLALKASRLASRYGRIVFEKELAKVAAICDEGPAVTALTTFRALDKLAGRALEWTPPAAPAILPLGRERREDPKLLLSEWSVGRLIEAAKPWELAAGEAPFTVVGDPRSAADWMPFVLAAQPHPIAPLSPAMAECQRRGWGGWWAREPLAWFSTESLQDSRRAHLYRSLLERLCHDSVSLLPARVLLASSQDRRAWLNRIPAEIRALRRALSLPLETPATPANDFDLAVSSAREAALLVSVAEKQRSAREGTSRT